MSIRLTVERSVAPDDLCGLCAVVDDHSRHYQIQRCTIKRIKHKWPISATIWWYGRLGCQSPDGNECNLSLLLIIRVCASKVDPSTLDIWSDAHYILHNNDAEEKGEKKERVVKRGKWGRGKKGGSSNNGTTTGSILLVRMSRASSLLELCCIHIKQDGRCCAHLADLWGWHGNKNILEKPHYAINVIDSCATRSI